MPDLPQSLTIAARSSLMVYVLLCWNFGCGGRPCCRQGVVLIPATQSVGHWHQRRCQCPMVHLTSASTAKPASRRHPHLAGLPTPRAPAPTEEAHVRTSSRSPDSNKTDHAGIAVTARFDGRGGQQDPASAAIATVNVNVRSSAAPSTGRRDQRRRRQLPAPCRGDVNIDTAAPNSQRAPATPPNLGAGM